MVISLFTSLVSSIRINEIELNPKDSDAGNEWLELYSNQTILLDGYLLQNEDGDIYNLSGKTEDYLVINFDKLWLDNSNSIIYLKQNDKIISQTSILLDSKNNNLTLNLCNESFILIQPSKGEVNTCPTEDKTIITENNLDFLSQDKIYLNKNNENISFISKDAKIRLYMTYSFTFIVVIILFLIYLRKL